MSSTWDQLKSIIGISAILSVYGIAALIIWFAGPSLGFNVTEQIIVIALLLITLPFVLLIGYLLKKRGSKRADAGEPQSQSANAPGTRNVHADSYEELTRGAEEAMQWLRSTKLGSAKAGDAAYRLPWLVFAGPPSSGKTAFLLSAGLDFQALPGQRRADQNLVRPTSDCVWRVTESAIMLDTAGRYQTEGPDSEEWSALIETLKKHRKTRPLDGFVITVNASQILGSREPQIEQQAKVLRARLDDVIARTRTRFPVYLLFTHLDSLEGFNDFFMPFDQAERAQVWGMTVPLEQSASAHTMFDNEFDYLYDSLIRRRLSRLSAAVSPTEQLRVFDFPLRFRDTRHKLGLFSTTLFRPNPFSESPLLRGFYFTSSAPPQPKAAPVRSASGADATVPLRALTETQAAGQGHFTRDFFRDVLFRDKDIAASFQAKQERPHRIHAIGLAAAAFVIFLITVGMLVSFFKNWNLIDESRELASRVDAITRSDAGKDPTKKEPAAAREELERVNMLRSMLARLDDYDHNSPPLFYRFGLYSGRSINPYVRAIYFDSVNQRFFQPVYAALEGELKSFASRPASDGPSGNPTGGNVPIAGAAASDSPNSDLGTHYDLLKTYLMLADPAKAEPTFLASQLSEYWKKSSPPDLELVSQDQLNFFASQAGAVDAPHIKADNDLVAESRRKLTAYPASERFYKRIKTETDAKVAPVTLEAILQGRGGGWLRSPYMVPGSFTIAGYREHMRDAIKSASEEMGKEDWVMGAAGGQSGGQGGDSARIQALYFQDYVTQWQKFLKSIRIADFKNKGDAVEGLKVLSASDSPLVQVLKTVTENTNLSADSSGGIIAWISGSKNSTAGKTEIDNQFRPLVQFIAADGDQKTAPLGQYLVELGNVRDALENSGGGQLEQTSKALLTNKNDFGLQKSEVKIGKLLDPFKTPASADAASMLKQPLGNLRALLFRGRYDEIEQSWRDQVFPKGKALESGYPFKGSGEASINDLAQFLNPADGQLTSFFNTNLQSSFDDVQGQWKLKEAGAFRFAPGFVDYLNGMRHLSEALFPRKDAKQPEVGYEITIQPVQGADIVIEIDGNRIAAQGSSPASATFTWPAKPGGSSGAKISIIPGGGQPANLTFPGTWGLFKMVDAGQSGRANDQIQLAWKVGSAVVHATIKPLSKTNPFEPNIFRKVSAPQSLK